MAVLIPLQSATLDCFLDLALSPFYELANLVRVRL